jgi:hypothetical protein
MNDWGVFDNQPPGENGAPSAGDPDVDPVGKNGTTFSGFSRTQPCKSQPAVETFLYGANLKAQVFFDI